MNLRHKKLSISKLYIQGINIMELLINLIWPLLILIIFWFLKNSIINLLNGLSKNTRNINKVKFGNLSFDFTPGSSSNENIKASQLNKNLLNKAFQHRLIFEEEEIIKKQLIDNNYTYEEALDLMIYHYSHLKFENAFLRLDFIIFPEQIELLHYLNVNGPKNDEELFLFYDKWKEKNLDRNYSFNNYLQFLFDSRLITRHGLNIDISIHGKEYLSYRIKKGLI